MLVSVGIISHLEVGSVVGVIVTENLGTLRDDGQRYFQPDSRTCGLRPRSIAIRRQCESCFSSKTAGAKTIEESNGYYVGPRSHDVSRHSILTRCEPRVLVRHVRATDLRAVEVGAIEIAERPKREFQILPYAVFW